MFQVLNTIQFNVISVLVGKEKENENALARVFDLASLFIAASNCSLYKIKPIL